MNFFVLFRFGGADIGSISVPRRTGLSYCHLSSRKEGMPFQFLHGGFEQHFYYNESQYSGGVTICHASFL